MNKSYFRFPKIVFTLLLVILTSSLSAQNTSVPLNLQNVSEEKTSEYIRLIKQNLVSNYPGMYREGGGFIRYPFIVPGSAAYSDVLWDWDSWLTDIALRQIIQLQGKEQEKELLLTYEKGCVLNFLIFAGNDGGTGNGWIPICVNRKPGFINGLFERPADIHSQNMHKPCLAQHAAFIVKQTNGDAGWLKESFNYLQYFLNNYYYYHRDSASGLYYWQTDLAIGVDNDPSTYYRPAKSSGSIYLNTMMYRELLAMVYISNQLKLDVIARKYQKRADDLKAAIRQNCWDERDGFYYSVDLNLLPVDPTQLLHKNMPRDWNSLIQRIGVWSGFMAMWAEVATPEEADRMVKENFYNEKTFNAPYGIRTLSKMEKMYNLKASGNPSSWLGPIWGISNYLTFRGLVKYGYKEEAKQLALKTIYLFGQDIEKNGVLHEYYEPDTGKPVINPGFQNWNYLVLNMIAWLEGDQVIEEF